MSDHGPLDAPPLANDPLRSGPPPAVETRLRRSRERRLLVGVAGGLAERFDINVYLVRAIFVVLTIFWGLGAAIYLVLWLVMGSSLTPSDDSVDVARPRVSTSHRLTFAVAAAVVALGILAVAVLRPVRALGPSVGLAWVVFLVVLAIVAIKTSSRRLTIRRVVGVAFLTAASGLILVISAVLAFLASTGVPLSGGIGDHHFSPSSFAQVRHAYRTEFGVATIDLSAVEFPVAGFSLVATVAAGQLDIVVPADAVVSLSTSVGTGRVSTSSSSVEGVGTSPYTSLPTGLSGGAGRSRPHVTIDARVGAGLIDLMRAVSPS